MNSGVDAAGVLGLLSTVLALGGYVWVALALSAMFRKMGEEQWRAWVPFVNAATLLRWGGFSPWLVLLALVPGVGAAVVGVLILISVHRLNPGFGYGGGLTVLAAFLFPVWATILGFGPAQWRGARLGGVPIPPPRNGAGASRPPSGASPPYAPFTAAPPRPPLGSDGPASALPPAPYPAPGGSLASPAVAPAPAPSGGAPAWSAAGTAGSAGSVAPQPWAPPPPAAPPAPPQRVAPVAAPARGAAPADEPVPASDGPLRHAPTPDADPVAWPAAPAPTVARSAPEPEPGPISAVPGGADGPASVGGESADVLPADAPATDSTAPTPTLREKYEESDMDEVSAISPAPFPPSSATASRPFVNPPVGPDEDDIISAVPGRSSAPAAPRMRPPAPDADPDDPFPELTGEVSAVAGAPAAGAPISASSSVAAQQREEEPAPAALPAATDGLDDELDQTVMVRRKRGLWELVPPSGAPIPLQADTVIVGRHPAPDPAFPRAQLVAIADPTRTVSKTHARLERRGDTWHIVDLGSTNGVLLPSLLGTDIEVEAGTDAEVAERFLLGDAALRLQRIELPG